MCLALPMKLIARESETGTVELDGVQRKVSLLMLPEASVGDHVLVHAGYAIGTVDAEEAEETVRLFHELIAAEERAARGTQTPATRGTQTPATRGTQTPATQETGTPETHETGAGEARETDAGQ